MMQNKVFSLLGLAMRGHRVVSGELQTLEAIKKGTAVLVILAEDASENTRKLFTDKCSFYEVEVVTYGTKEQLGRAIGKDERSSVGICDEGLAKAVVDKMQTEQ